MRVERVGLGEHRVVAALHHPRAAGSAEQSLHDHGDRKGGRSIGGVQRGAEAGAARAEDENVGLDAVDYRTHEPVTARLTVTPS